MNEILKRYFEDGTYDDANTLIDTLLYYSDEDIVENVVSTEEKAIEPYSIPQYSSYEDGTVNMIHYLRCIGDFGPSFVEIGKHYLGSDRNDVAYRKYGENHAKLAEVLGLAYIVNDGSKRVHLTEIGRELEKRDIEVQKSCIKKLAGQIPIVQKAIRDDFKSSKELESLMRNYLSESTVQRRRKNTWDLVCKLRGDE